jgi:uncharacterized damage-inducible protein DinB
MMPNETSASGLLADRIVRAFTGPMWHGPAVAEILAGVSHEQAIRRPIPNAHSIWELTLHIGTWVDIPKQRLGGMARKNVPTDEDWPAPPALSADAWRAAVAKLEEQHRGLATKVRTLTDEQLAAKAVGEEYTVLEMLNGVVEHSTYHGGQIALLKKLAAGA